MSSAKFMRKPANTHEMPSSPAEVQLGSDRTFGLVFAVVFGLVSGFPLIIGKPYHLWAGGLSVAFLATALVLPRFLRPLNRIWFRIGALLHKIASPLVMGLLFFSTILPTSLLMRLFGKRPLTLKFDTAAKSYWIKRGPAEPSPASMKNQF